jgi:hypothetical protein
MQALQHVPSSVRPGTWVKGYPEDAPEFAEALFAGLDGDYPHVFEDGYRDGHPFVKEQLGTADPPGPIYKHTPSGCAERNILRIESLDD